MIAITGVTGFLGKGLVESFLKDNYMIKAVVRRRNTMDVHRNVSEIVLPD